MLVDLEKIFPRPKVEEEKEEIPEPVVEIEPEVKKVSYEESDPSYEPPPSEIPAEIQAIIDSNLVEVFNIYCRKFASLKGDFSELQ